MTEDLMAIRTTPRRYDVELTVDGGGEHVRCNRSGHLAPSIAACILRLADRYAADEDMQRLAAAVKTFTGR